MQTATGNAADKPADKPTHSHHRPRIRWGRKDVAVGLALLVPTTIATVAMFVDKMAAETWVSFCQFYIPAVVGLYVSANVAQKAMTKRERSETRREEVGE